MGILSSIKKMFSKNIDCSEKLGDTPFYNYSLTNRVVYVGSNIIVKEGYEAVFVCRNKVTDCLPAGKHSIIASNLPNTFKRMHLLKANGKGNFKNKFKVDIYFVQKHYDIIVEFLAKQPYEAKTKTFGRVKAFPEGKCIVNVTDSKKLISFLLLERPYATTKDFFSTISEQVGNAVSEKLMKSNKPFIKILTEKSDISEYFKIVMLNLDYMGVEVNAVDIISMQVSPMLEKKVSEKLKEYRDANVDISTDSFEEVPTICGLNVSFDGNITSEQKNTKTCYACGGVVDGAAKFCPNCGAKQNLG